MKNASVPVNNRLIRKSIVRMFPACFAATLAGSMSLMVDSLLAGSLIGQLAIAAVAIGNPVTGVFRALIQAISNGAAVRLTICVGRGDRQNSNRSYSLGIVGSLLFGLAFVLIAFLLADPLVLLFGGSANPQVAAQAALYLRSCALMIAGSSLNIFFAKVLAIYGHQKESFLVALVGAVSNIAFSILSVKLLPAAYAIAGLGIGTCVGSLLQVLLFCLVIFVKRVPLKFSFAFFTSAELGDILKLGFPSSSNSLIDGLIAGLINNIILRGFGGDTTALSVYTAVKGVFSFAQAAPLSASTATSPLFGLLYGARDKNGIKRTLREGFLVGLAFSAAWCFVMIALLPVLLKFYGMAGNANLEAVVRSGVYITMVFIPVILLLRVMTTLFESTEKFSMGLLYSIVPDSVIYPIMLVLLLPLWKYTGIWISFGANGVVFLALLYLVRSLKNKSLRLNVDRMLCLDETIRDNVPKMDISIHSNSGDVSAISASAHDFLTAEGASVRTAYMASLCLEELAADFAAKSAQQKKGDREIMDVKLFSDAECIRIVIRNADKPYNPLDFELNDETFSKVGVKLAQKVALRIEYAYVYKMNIITIDLAR